jgi:hypothetical protein
MDPNLTLGTISPQETDLVCPAIPPLTAYDVIVPQTMNVAFYVNQVAIVSELRGVPLIQRARVRLAEFSDIAHLLPISV